jgi:hypothetical protein
VKIKVYIVSAGKTGDKDPFGETGEVTITQKRMLYKLNLRV